MSNKQNNVRQNNQKNQLPSQSYQYSGPLPPSSEMRNYGIVDKTLPNRIMELAEKQTNHRIEMEKKSMDLNEQEMNANIFLTKWGLYLGFFLIMSALTCAFVMIIKGQYTGGIFSIMFVLVTLAITWYKANKRK
ncbi:hypothetical protein [Fructobacillus cardui]|uniref:Uncharacterized membrane protein n=1 Tax=Fructobacillus cardui TaxID=2893170 RepID=A0ABN9YVA4_9LACO|nr:Uncharacterized membrane protein [Fructobacillus cardui]